MHDHQFLEFNIRLTLLYRSALSFRSRTVPLVVSPDGLRTFVSLRSGLTELIQLDSIESGNSGERPENLAYSSAGRDDKATTTRPDIPSGRCTIYFRGAIRRLSQRWNDPRRIRSLGIGKDKHRRRDNAAEAHSLNRALSDYRHR